MISSMAPTISEQSLDSSLRDLAISVYHALSELQIRQNRLESDTDGSWVLRHPLQGVLAIPPQEILDGRDDFVRIAGIGLQKTEQGRVEVLDYGGIFDPLSGEVIGDHYSTSHFAWLASILKEEPCWREHVTAAFAFHEKTHRWYPFSKQEPHWEFNNLAWMGIWFRVKDSMPELSDRLRSVLLAAPWHPRPYGTNWKLMLSAFLLLRHKAFGRFQDRVLGYLYLKWALSLQDRDGCLLDVPRNGSRSLQYHAYSTALLFRMCDMGLVGSTVETRAMRAADWLLAHSAPDGDCNWRGRGQGQIFGYAASDYVFRSAIRRAPLNESAYRLSLQRLQDFIIAHRRTTGLLPLVLNEYPDEARVGWYDYNHLTVYNAFCGVWFALPPHISSSEASAEVTREAEVVHFVNSRVVIVRTEHIYFSVSGGERAYPSEAGLTPQMIWIWGIGSIIRGAGGPGHGSYGIRYALPQERHNFAAPLVVSESGGLTGPEFSRHHLSVWDNNIRLEGEYGGIHLIRTIDWSGQNGKLLVITDTVSAASKNMEQVKVIPFNLPLLANNVTAVNASGTSVALVFPQHSLVLDFQIAQCPAAVIVGEVEPQPLGPSLRIMAAPIVLRSNESRTVSQRWRLIDRAAP